jgi:MerR family mercuric resistance operon transcriptional regulator
MPPRITSARAQHYTIGEIAELTGVNLETIRYFEKIGLIGAADRSAGGHRQFTAEHAERLQFIRHARDMGFSQDDVRALLGLSDGSLTSCGQVKLIAERHLAQIRQRIGRMKRLERLLAVTVSRCKGGEVPVCPVIDVIARHEPRA